MSQPPMTLADTIAQDIRFGARSIRRDAAAAIFIVAMVAIGIGASTTVFSLCRALLIAAKSNSRIGRVSKSGPELMT